MHTESSIEIDRPIHEVYDFTVNHVPEWSIIVVEDEVIESKPGGTGSTFRVVTEERGRRMEFQGTVLKQDAPRLQEVIMRGEQFDMHVTYSFEDLGDSTRLIQRSDVQARGFLKVMFVLFGWAMKKSGCDAQMNELKNLKRILEGQQTSGASTVSVG